MKCRSENSDVSCVMSEAYSVCAAQYAVPKTQRKAFSLIEVVAALVILSFVSLSMLVVINRSLASAADSVLRMQAFGIARENMEVLLAAESVQEMVESGFSDRYPEIQWQTIVELFSEPITAETWVQAVCSAEYTDTDGELQKVELIHWLTDLTKEQLREIMEDRVIKTIEDAADYAGVDIDTIEQWVENGMPVTKEGYYIKSELDLYKQTEGSPTPEDRNPKVEDSNIPSTEP